MDKLGQSRSPGLAELLRAAVREGLAQVHTAIPGIVESYDPEKQTAEVRPAVGRPYVNLDGSEGLDEYPVLPNVPVGFPRGGGYFMTLPLQKGDAVLLIFSEQSIDSWSESDGKNQVDPIDFRRFDLSDAFAIPGGNTVSRALGDAVASGLVLGQENGHQIRFTGDSVDVTTGGGESAADFVALAAKVQTALDKIQQTFDAHLHLGNLGAVTGPSIDAALLPSLILPTGPVESSNLKAD